MILAGDVGGTKTVLALCDAALAITRQRVFACADYPSLEAVLDAFLVPSDRPDLTAACFGVAGPVVQGIAKITNLPWTISAPQLAAELGGIPVSLINDLQATALGMLVLPDTAFAVLQAVAATPSGSIAVIAPGTGLGEASLVFDGTRHRALASEGGHADFAPSTDDEIGLLRYLRTQHGGHVSYERVLSGAGIGAIYDFLRKTAATPEPAWLTAQLAHGDRNAAISHVALEATDPVCVRALDMFVEILGAEAGNLALRVLATGGVVLGGGIPPKILPALQHQRFIDRFNAKGRMGSWTRTVGVRVALEPRAALFGAAHHAATYKDPRS